MSMLHQNPQEPIDDAALGEEFTRGTSHVVWAAIIATILVSVAIALYFITGTRPPAAAGEVLQVWAHPIHTETSGFDANGEPMAKESFDQILVFAHVRVRNQSANPIQLGSVLCNLTLADGIHSSYIASPSEYERIFRSFPGLTAMHGNPLPSEYNLQPGQVLDGYTVSAFRITKEQWSQHRDLNFTFGFRYQPVLKLIPQVAMQEQ